MEETGKTNHNTTSKRYRRKMLLSYFSSTLCIALVLYLAGIFMMLLFNTQHITDMFRSNIKLTITLNDKRSHAEVENFKKILDASDFVRETKYITKDQAADELKEELGEDFVEILGKNPLYSQIEVKLSDEYSNIDSINSIEKQLKQHKTVDEVFYPKNVWNNATTVITKIATIVLILTIILLIITIILIVSTVKVQMAAKRFDIRTAKMIGATNWTVSKPYIKKTLIQSLIAVMLSLIGLSITVSMLEKIIAGVFQIAALTPTILVMTLLGISVTCISAFFTVRKYINADEDELYF